MTEWIDDFGGLQHLSQNPILGQMLQSRSFSWFASGAVSISGINAGDRACPR